MSVDAIVTTSPPVSAHMIGRKAKEMFGLSVGRRPARSMVAESGAGQRSGSPAGAVGGTENFARCGCVGKRFGPWADRLREFYPDKSVFSITNGFDADDFRPKPEALTPNFTITYTGRLYKENEILLRCSKPFRN